MEIVKSTRIKNPDMNQDSLYIEFENGSGIFIESYEEAMSLENGELKYLKICRDYLNYLNESENIINTNEEPHKTIEEVVNLDITQIE